MAMKRNSNKSKAQELSAVFTEGLSEGLFRNRQPKEDINTFAFATELNETAEAAHELLGDKIDDLKAKGLDSMKRRLAARGLTEHALIDSLITYLGVTEDDDDLLEELANASLATLVSLHIERPNMAAKIAAKSKAMKMRRGTSSAGSKSTPKKGIGDNPKSRDTAVVMTIASYDGKPFNLDELSKKADILYREVNKDKEIQPNLKQSLHLVHVALRTLVPAGVVSYDAETGLYSSTLAFKEEVKEELDEAANGE